MDLIKSESSVMGLTKYFRPKIPADRAAWVVGKSLIDPDDCWRDVSSLRGYNVAGSVATCEMAFARSAVAKTLYESVKSKEVSVIMVEALQGLLRQSFVGDPGPELSSHYQMSNLTEIMLTRTSFYNDTAFPFGQLAMHLVLAIGVPDGRDATQIRIMLEKAYARAEKMLGQARLSAKRESSAYSN